MALALSRPPVPQGTLACLELPGASWGSRLPVSFYSRMREDRTHTHLIRQSDEGKYPKGRLKWCLQRQGGYFQRLKNRQSQSMQSRISFKGAIYRPTDVKSSLWPLRFAPFPL